jgi:two-component sensor histidine kinase/integral membrane sensor domain MASE1
VRFSSTQFSRTKGVKYAPILREEDFYAEDLQKLFSFLLSGLAKPTQQLFIFLTLAGALGLAYFFAARLGLALLTKPDGVAVFWPAAGVASGMLIALGPSARGPVVAGTMAATIVANLLGDRTIWSALVFAVCNAGEAVIVAGLIERYFGSAFSLGRLLHVLGLLGAAVVGTTISGIGGTIGFLFHSSTAPALSTWQHWLTSDALGIVTVAPLLIGLVSSVRDPPSHRDFIEGMAALVTLTVLSAITIFLPRETWATVIPIAALFPLLLWLAARCKPVFAAAAAFIVAFTIVWTTTFGIGFFGDANFPVAERILLAQAGILAVSLCSFVLAALFAERRQHEAVLMESEARLQQALERQNWLVAELDHRVKNMLARVATVVMQTREGSGTLDHFVKALDGRIQSMAAAHSLLSQSRWQGSGINDLVRDQLAPYATEANASIGGPNAILTAATTQALAMVLHELVTNAAKYGALSIPGGHVSVTWEKPSTWASTAKLTVMWRETGCTSVAAPTQFGFGTSLIRDLIPHELGGSVDLVFETAGVSCKIEVPLERL